MSESARLCAWIAGLTLAALLCMFFGDHLAALDHLGVAR